MIKFNNRTVDVGGDRFDSRKEANRWAELQIMERAGLITDLRRQVKFILIPTQREPDTTGPRGGRKPGKLLEKECAYFADFVYCRDGKTVVEDAKGFKTEAYKIKRKLMLWRYGIRILET